MVSLRPCRGQGRSRPKSDFDLFGDGERIRRPRCRGTGRCFPAWYALAATARLSGCRFSYKSAPPWCAASSGSRKPSYQGRRARPSDGRSERTAVSRRAAGRAVVQTAGEQVLPASEVSSGKPVADCRSGLLGDFELDGLPVFRWITVARSCTRPPRHTSLTRSRTRSHPLNLLSMARLNSARSRLRRSSWSRTRIVQTSLGLSGRFWPVSRPLFHGALPKPTTAGVAVCILASSTPTTRRSADHPLTRDANLTDVRISLGKPISDIDAEYRRTCPSPDLRVKRPTRRDNHQ